MDENQKLHLDKIGHHLTKSYSFKSIDPCNRKNPSRSDKSSRITKISELGITNTSGTQPIVIYKKENKNQSYYKQIKLSSEPYLHISDGGLKKKLDKFNVCHSYSIPNQKKKKKEDPKKKKKYLNNEEKQKLLKNSITQEKIFAQTMVDSFKRPNIPKKQRNNAKNNRNTNSNSVIENNKEKDKDKDKSPFEERHTRHHQLKHHHKNLSENLIEDESQKIERMNKLVENAIVYELRKIQIQTDNRPISLKEKITVRKKGILEENGIESISNIEEEKEEENNGSEKDKDNGNNENNNINLNNNDDDINKDNNKFKSNKKKSSSVTNTININSSNFMNNNINYNNFIYTNNDEDQLTLDITKKKKKLKPKVNQFEFLEKIQEEQKKLPFHIDIPTGNKRTLSKNISTSKINDSFRHKSTSFKDKDTNNNNNNCSSCSTKNNFYSTGGDITKKQKDRDKDNKENERENKEKFQYIKVKSKNQTINEGDNVSDNLSDEFPFAKKKNCRTIEELIEFEKKKKIKAKKEEESKEYEKNRKLFLIYKNLCNLGLKDSFDNNNHANHYNNISNYTNFNNSSSTKLRNHNKKNLYGKHKEPNEYYVGTESSRNSSTVLDLNEYYLNILESQQLLVNNGLNKITSSNDEAENWSVSNNNKILFNNFVNNENFNNENNNFNNENNSNSNSIYKNIKIRNNKNNELKKDDNDLNDCGTNDNNNNNLINDEQFANYVNDTIKRANDFLSQGSIKKKPESNNYNNYYYNNPNEKQKIIFPNESQHQNQNQNNQLINKQDSQKNSKINSNQKDNSNNNSNNNNTPKVIQIKIDNDNNINNNNLNLNTNSEMITKEKNLPSLPHTFSNNSNPNKKVEVDIQPCAVLNLVEIIRLIFQRKVFFKIYQIYMNQALSQRYVIAFSYFVAICKQFPFKTIEDYCNYRTYYYAFRQLIRPFIRRNFRIFIGNCYTVTKTEYFVESLSRMFKFKAMERIYFFSQFQEGSNQLKYICNVIFRTVFSLIRPYLKEYFKEFCSNVKKMDNRKNKKKSQNQNNPNNKNNKNNYDFDDNSNINSLNNERNRNNGKEKDKDKDKEKDKEKPNLNIEIDNIDLIPTYKHLNNSCKLEGNLFDSFESKSSLSVHPNSVDNDTLHQLQVYLAGKNSSKDNNQILNEKSVRSLKSIKSPENSNRPRINKNKKKINYSDDFNNNSSSYINQNNNPPSNKEKDKKNNQSKNDKDHKEKNKDENSSTGGSNSDINNLVIHKIRIVKTNIDNHEPNKDKKTKNDSKENKIKNSNKNKDNDDSGINSNNKNNVNEIIDDDIFIEDNEKKSSDKKNKNKSDCKDKANDPLQNSDRADDPFSIKYNRKESDVSADRDKMSSIEWDYNISSQVISPNDSDKNDQNKAKFNKNNNKNEDSKKKNTEEEEVMMDFDYDVVTDEENNDYNNNNDNNPINNINNYNDQKNIINIIQNDKNNTDKSRNNSSAPKIKSDNLNEEENNKNIIKKNKQSPLNKMKNLNEQFCDKLTEEVINKIIYTEITAHDHKLLPTKLFKFEIPNLLQTSNILTNNSNNSFNGNINITNNNNNTNNSNTSKETQVGVLSTISLRDDGLRSYNESVISSISASSVFNRTIKDKKNEHSLNLYLKKIAPLLIQLIRKEIYCKYSRIYDNISVPLRNEYEGLMVALELQDGEMLRKYYKRSFNVESIKDIVDKEKILKQFEPINKQIRKKENIIDDNYYDNMLNECVIDTAVEIIKKQKIYRGDGEPLPWSTRTHELFFKYERNNPKKLADFVIKELYSLLNKKLGMIPANYEYLTQEQIDAIKDKKLVKMFKAELEESEPNWKNLEIEETQLKIEITEVINEQLFNEVIEILEHIVLSRKRPDLYQNKSVFACEEIPKLSFQISESKANLEAEENDLINIE